VLFSPQNLDETVAILMGLRARTTLITKVPPETAAMSREETDRCIDVPGRTTKRSIEPGNKKAAE
jgi:hypothetical protein